MSAYGAKRPLVLLIWKQSVPWWRFHGSSCVSCKEPLLIVEELECVEEADMIVWGCWNAVPGPPGGMAKPAHQLWMYFCMESLMSGHLGQPLGFPEFLADFDLVSSFQLNATFPRLYTPGDPALLLLPPRPKKRKVAWVASHCGRHNGNFLRDDYVLELMKYIQVDAMGSCLQNRKFPSQHDTPPEHGSALLPIYAEYHFTLAFHDSNSWDYVDEKLYLPLLAGSVPVFSGTPNVRKFLPDPEAIVDTRDYPSPKELAAYLHRAIEEPSVYQRHLAWKHRALAPSMRELVQHSFYKGASQYGEAQHHGFPTPGDMCAFSSRAMEEWRKRQG